jgi:hypothetical protein
MRRLIAPSLVILLLSAAITWATTYTNSTTGQQSPGAVIECGATNAPGTPCGNATTPLVTSNSGGVAPLNGTFTNRSGTIATGGTSQALAAVNASRKRILIQNPCSATSQNIAAAENLVINFTSAASIAGGTSIELLPCGSYDSGGGPVSTEAITVNATTSGHQYVAKEM